MSNRRIIFWLFSLALAAVAANFFLVWQAPAGRASARQFLLEPTFDTLSVAIERPGEPQTVLSRTDGKWALVEPYAGAVDAQTVLKLVDAFSFSMADDTLSSAELLKLGRTRADFGLQNPRLTVTFSNAVDVVRIAFGALTPMSNEVYAVCNGSDAVSVVPASVFAAADLTSDAFRERAVFPYEPEFVTGFDLKHPDATVLSFSREGETWRIGERAASLPKVAEFLSLLADANASGFVWPVGATNEATVASSALLSGYGLDADSAVVLTLRCRDGRDRRLLLGRDVGQAETYALIRGGEAIVKLPAALKAAALQNAQTFADARLFPLTAATVASFSVSDGVTSYIVAREAGGVWRLDAPVAAVADAAFAGDVLGRLLALTPADLDPEGLKVTVSTNLPSFVVSARSLLGKGRLDDLRSREILKVDPALVRRLVSTPGASQDGASVSLVRQRERRTWTVESDGGVDGEVRASVLEAVLQALSPLQASRIVTLKASSAELARYGLERPYHTLAVDQEKEGAVRRNVLIGAEAKDGRYATVGSSEAVFVLPRKVVDVLTAPLVEK